MVAGPPHWGRQILRDTGRSSRTPFVWLFYLQNNKLRTSLPLAREVRGARKRGCERIVPTDLSAALRPRKINSSRGLWKKGGDGGRGTTWRVAKPSEVVGVGQEEEGGRIIANARAGMALPPTGSRCNTYLFLCPGGRLQGWLRSVERQGHCRVGGGGGSLAT